MSIVGSAEPWLLPAIGRLQLVFDHELSFKA
jgi:hypothetical protein